MTKTNNLFTKWGVIAVLIIVIGTIISTVVTTSQGISTWLGDNYVPKKIMILEKFPVRIIMYGEYPDGINPNTLTNIIKTLDNVKYESEGDFKNNMHIQVGTSFNTKQIRSSERSLYKVIPDVTKRDTNDK